MPYTYYLHHIPTGKHYYGVRTAKKIAIQRRVRTEESKEKTRHSLKKYYENLKGLMENV